MTKKYVAPVKSRKGKPYVEETEVLALLSIVLRRVWEIVPAGPNKAMIEKAYDLLAASGDLHTFPERGELKTLYVWLKKAQLTDTENRREFEIASLILEALLELCEARGLSRSVNSEDGH